MEVDRSAKIDLLFDLTVHAAIHPSANGFATTVISFCPRLCPLPTYYSEIGTDL